MTPKSRLLGTAAIIAVSTAFGAAGVHAQAAVDIVLTGAVGTDQSIDKSGDQSLTNDQELVNSGDIISSTSNNTAPVVEDITSGTDGLFTSAVSQENGLISSSATGNEADGSVVIATVPTTAGNPAAVGNLQAVEAGVQASSTNDTISVLVENNGNGVRSFASTLTMDNNDFTASATGNLSEARIDVPANTNVEEATSTSGEASVAIDETLSATGSADRTTNVVDDDSEARADLIVSSAQEIDGIEVGGDLAVSATVANATTTTRVEGLGDPTVNNVNGGSITVTNSDQSSEVIGNEATNDIVADGNNPDITASAAVANVQSITAANGNTTSILAETTGSEISSVAGVELGGQVTGDITDSTVSVTANTQSSSATGSDSVQTLTLDGNTLTGEDGGASVGDSDPTASTGMQLAADADAVIANVQRTGEGNGSVTITSNTNDNRITSRAAPADGNVTGSTLTVDGNAQRSSATGQLTSNDMSLTGSASADDMSGAVASIQELGSSTSVTASTVGEGGIPVLNVVEGNFESSRMSTSNNVVSATARGNTTTAGGNSVTVDGNDITNTGTGDASPNILAGTGLEGTTPDTTGSFVTASSQVSAATITATQIGNDGSSDFSNTIETQIDDSIGSLINGDPENPTSVVSDGNLLSVSGTANRASNDVSLGGENMASIEASAALANYQGTTGSVTAEIGVLGSDATTAVSSSNAPDNNDFAPSAVSEDGNNLYTNTSNGPLTFTFSDATDDEIDILRDTFGSQNISTASGTTTVTWNDTQQVNFGTIPLVISGTDFVNIANLSRNATSGTLNDSGVIVRLDADNGGTGGIYASTVSVSNNIVSGAANGNVVPDSTDSTGSTNSISVEASTVTGLDSSTTTSITANDSIVDPSGADLALGNLQENAAELESNVYASFAIIDDQNNIDDIQDSSQTVSENRQESFATANRATNTVDLTATNTDADTALESVQLSNAPVSTDSDMDVVANAGGLRSSLNMDSNQNVSVASGNVVSNAVTVDATNANVGTVADASLDFGTGIVTGNNVLASEQISSASVTADATTDVYNQDVVRTDGNVIEKSSVSFSGNTTIAQATANNTGPDGNELNLTGVDTKEKTASMDRTGALMNIQTTSGAPDTDAVSADVNEEISVELVNTSTVPVQSSTLSLNDNVSSAFARGNNAVNALTVSGANIGAGTNNDATLNTTTITSPNLEAAYLLTSSQTNNVNVVARTTQSRIEIDMSNADGGAVDDSTLSVSGNTASATARGNAVVNTLESGAKAANADATTALVNRQFNNTPGARISAIGGTDIGVFATSSGVQDPSAIDGSSVSVSNNSSETNAIGNRAVNTLSAVGTSINSGDPSSGSVGNALVDASGDPGDVDANAGILLVSEQSNNSRILSRNNNNTLTIEAQTVDGNGAAALNSTLTASGNTVDAIATANMAFNNDVTIGNRDTSKVGSTGMVSNFQFNNNSGSVDAEASTTTRIRLSGAAGSGALSDSSAEISGNTTEALARGNFASNALNAQSTNADTVSGGSSTTATSPDSAVINASFGVFSEQVQQASINATVKDASYEVRATSGTGDALNNTSLNVSGNSIRADAYGNVSTSSVTMAALNGTGSTSAAVFNGQINSGQIKAEASGNSIGTFSDGGVSNTSIVVTGNSISATAVGNFSSNTVTRTNR